MSNVTVDRRLYKAADGSLVEAGDRRGVSLWGIPGQIVTVEEAERAGYEPAAELDTVTFTEASGKGDLLKDPKPEPEPVDERVCPQCGKRAKTKAGRIAHERSHDSKGD